MLVKFFHFIYKVVVKKIPPSSHTHPVSRQCKKGVTIFAAYTQRHANCCSAKPRQSIFFSSHNSNCMMQVVSHIYFFLGLFFFIVAHVNIIVCSLFSHFFLSYVHFFSIFNIFYVCLNVFFCCVCFSNYLV